MHKNNLKHNSTFPVMEALEQAANRKSSAVWMFFNVSAAGSTVLVPTCTVSAVVDGPAIWIPHA